MKKWFAPLFSDPMRDVERAIKNNLQPHTKIQRQSKGARRKQIGRETWREP